MAQQTTLISGTTVYLALSPELDCVTGKYLDEKQRIVEPSPAAGEPATQQALRQLSRRLTGL